MSSELFRSRILGLVLSLMGVVAITALALTGRLGFYIHPRYFGFTVTLAAVAAVFIVVAAFVVLRHADDDDPDHVHDGHVEHDGHGHAHAHAHDHGGHPSSPWRARLATLGALFAIAAVGFVLLVVPPATLTTSTAQARDMNGAVDGPSSGSSGAQPITLVGGDYHALTIKDWAALLRQQRDPAFYGGKTPTLVGFVTPDQRDPENVFYVARFIVTCCAVDAQPVGVPVHRPGWQAEFPVDSWVSVTGSFDANPATGAGEPIVLVPSEIARTEQPKDPYVY